MRTLVLRNRVVDRVNNGRCRRPVDGACALTVGGHLATRNVAAGCLRWCGGRVLAIREVVVDGGSLLLLTKARQKLLSDSANGTVRTGERLLNLVQLIVLSAVVTAELSERSTTSVAITGHAALSLDLLLREARKADVVVPAVAELE